MPPHINLFRRADYVANLSPRHPVLTDKNRKSRKKRKRRRNHIKHPVRHANRRRRIKPRQNWINNSVTHKDIITQNKGGESLPLAPARSAVFRYPFQRAQTPPATPALYRVAMFINAKKGLQCILENFRTVYALFICQCRKPGRKRKSLFYKFRQ